MNDGSCCPKNSLPQFKTDYSPKGTYEIFADIKYYITGDLNSTKAIVLITDLFGPDSGRPKNVADYLGENGFYVIVPDLIEGEWYNGSSNVMEWIKRYEWGILEKSLTDSIIPFLKKEGKEDIGLIGFCWGSWYIFKACSNFDIFKCGVNCHPSLRILGMFNEDIETVTKAVKCKQLLLPAGNDDDNVKEDGIVLQILKEKFGDDCYGYFSDYDPWVGC
jgi:dienelactone hydrolase